MNWGWLLLRIGIGLTVLTTIFLSQRFWYRAVWRTTGRWRSGWLRIAARLLYCLALALIVLAIAGGFRMGRHGHLNRRDAALAMFSGLWLSSAFFAFLFVEIVHGAYPVVPQDEGRRSWLAPMLEGIYSEWLGAQGGDPSFTARLAEPPTRLGAPLTFRYARHE